MARVLIEAGISRGGKSRVSRSTRRRDIPRLEVILMHISKRRLPGVQLRYQDPSAHFYIVNRGLSKSFPPIGRCERPTNAITRDESPPRFLRLRGNKTISHCYGTLGSRRPTFFINSRRVQLVFQFVPCPEEKWPRERQICSTSDFEKWSAHFGAYGNAIMGGIFIYF